MTTGLTGSNTALVERMARVIALKALGSIRRGTLEVLLPDGSRRLFGRTGTGPSASIRVKSNDLFAKLLRGGEIAFGESYMDGMWESADLTSLLILGILNRQTVPLFFRKLNEVSRIGSRRVHRASRNTKSGSRSNVQAHYDLSNAFFALFLDESMTYSSAVFSTPEQSLECAQLNKYAILCNKADIRPGHKVLEIGCGWGGFAIHAARKNECSVEAVTLSRAQLDFARKRVEEEDLEALVHVDLRDYRDVKGCYDRIVAIEMFEAVGAEYFRTFFEKCDLLLKPGGRLVLQTISVPERSFAGLRDGVNWMQKYIFPGGMLPSLAEVERAIGNTSLVIGHVEDIAPHYVTTLQRWRQRFEASLDKVRDMGFDERFIRMWRYYLCAAEAGFATRSTSDVQIILEKCDY